ncbi:hypothetical protein M0R45_001988 [Rubus argutus]|uniref:Uncharacterized protein n=1 Tax=Rubus argutus TaxID=59490 RepID=A0AAW1VRX5_RUBAR
MYRIGPKFEDSNSVFCDRPVDLPCIVHIISQILAVSSQVSRRRRRQWRRFKLAEHALEMAKRISWLCPYLLIDILAILPIPQVVILILLTRTRGSKSLNARKFLNSLVIFQYVPRAFRMYRSCKEANKTERTQKSASTTDKTDPDNWNGYTLCLKVYKFILASHVFGALWYYFSAHERWIVGNMLVEVKRNMKLVLLTVMAITLLRMSHF